MSSFLPGCAPTAVNRNHIKTLLRCWRSSASTPAIRRGGVLRQSLSHLFVAICGNPVEDPTSTSLLANLGLAFSQVPAVSCNDRLRRRSVSPCLEGTIHDKWWRRGCAHQASSRGADLSSLHKYADHEVGPGKSRRSHGAGPCFGAELSTVRRRR